MVWRRIRKTLECSYMQIGNEMQRSQTNATKRNEIQRNEMLKTFNDTNAGKQFIIWNAMKWSETNATKREFKTREHTKTTPDANEIDSLRRAMPTLCIPKSILLRIATPWTKSKSTNAQGCRTNGQEIWCKQMRKSANMYEIGIGTFHCYHITSTYCQKLFSVNVKKFIEVETLLT